MQKTLARGEQTIYACRVIDSCCQRYKAEGDKKTYKKYIKLSQWKAVMEAGLRDSVIARYSDGQGAEDKPNMPRVTLQLPPAGDERACALYHNELMRLCLLPLSTLFDRIREKMKRARRREPELWRRRRHKERQRPRIPDGRSRSQRRARRRHWETQWTCKRGRAVAGALDVSLPRPYRQFLLDVFP